MPETASLSSLAPFQFLTKFVLTPNAVERFSLVEVDRISIPNYLEPEKQLWKYELLKSRKKELLADIIKKQIEGQFPGSI